MPAAPKVALFLGRFQPFHRGHLSVLLDLLKEYDHVVVGIGSSDKSRTTENPFTVGERHAMVKAALMDEGYTAEKDFVVVPVTDIGDDEKYPKHVIDTCPKFDVYVTGEAGDRTAALFEKKAKTKKIIIAKRKYKISGTAVREAIVKGEDLEKYLHPAVVAFLQKIGAARKIIDITAEEAFAAAEAAAAAAAATK